MAFLPKTHTLILIRRKDETNTNYQAFYKITNQHYSKASQQTGKTKELSQIGKDKDDVELNAMWYPGLDSEIEEAYQW